jgi:purine-cytosine permease-like protein
MVKQRYASALILMHFILSVLQDLDPIPYEKRTWTGIDYWAYWCSDMLAPPLASTVSSVMGLGFTARETIPIVFFGFLICSVIITLTGKIGATYHVPFPVAVRSTFGMYGSYPMICIRCKFFRFSNLISRANVISLRCHDVDCYLNCPSWSFLATLY